MIHWLSHLYNIWLDPLKNEGYAWWSGMGSGSPIIAGIAVWWHHHNCHEPHCWKIGHADSTGKVICKKHHPNVDRRNSGKADREAA